jgi:hypothetical protein
LFFNVTLTYAASNKAYSEYITCNIGSSPQEFRYIDSKGLIHHVARIYIEPAVALQAAMAKPRLIDLNKKM